MTWSIQQAIFMHLRHWISLLSTPLPFWTFTITFRISEKMSCEKICHLFQKSCLYQTKTQFVYRSWKKINWSARYYPQMFQPHFLSSTRINKVLVQSFSRSLKPLKGGQWVTNKEFGSEILALHRNSPTLVLKGP